jgi:hypothetical protein
MKKKPENKSNIHQYPRHIREKVTVTLQLPEAFTAACQQFTVTEQEALQFFINHLSFAAYILTERDHINSIATAIFDGYSNTRPVIPIANKGKRDICLKFTKKAIALLMGREQSATYTAIIAEWYEKLLEFNQQLPDGKNI